MILYDELPRRCRKHGEVTSSDDGMFDAPCGACEWEIEDRFRQDEWNALPAEERARREAELAEIEARLNPPSTMDFTGAGDGEVPF